MFISHNYNLIPKEDASSTGRAGSELDISGPLNWASGHVECSQGISSPTGKSLQQRDKVHTLTCAVYCIIVEILVFVLSSVLMGRIKVTNVLFKRRMPGSTVKGTQ